MANPVQPSSSKPPAVSPAAIPISRTLALSLAMKVRGRNSGEGSWARGIIRWRVGPWWYVVVVGLPVGLISVQGALFGLLGYPLDLASIPGRLVNFLPSAIVLALIAGLGEEPGWRGFALPRLETRLAPLLATALLGFMWAMWHLPLVFVDPSTTSLGTGEPLETAFCVRSIVGKSQRVAPNWSLSDSTAIRSGPSLF